MASAGEPTGGQAAALYESAKKIYPREIEGRFATLSKIASMGVVVAFSTRLVNDSVIVSSMRS